MAAVPADTHDREKMERWHQGLEGWRGSSFPVCAIFLVSGEDHLAHDIFRRYRTSFAAKSAEFHNLIIFGQHGISTAITGLLDRWGLPLESLPYLAVAPGARAREITFFKLSPGDHPGSTPDLEREANLDEPWQLILDRVEEAVAQGSKTVDVSGITGAAAVDLGGKSLAGLVDGLLNST